MLSESAYETTDMVVRVTKFDVSNYRHVDVLLRVNRIKDPEIAFRDISNAHVLFHVQSFCTYVFDHPRESLSLTSTTAASRSEACEGSLSSTPRVLGEAVAVVLLVERYRLQTLHDLQKAGGFV